MGLVGGFHSLPMAQCDDGQEGGFGRRFWCVCVVPCWVRVTPTCINELMQRLMLAFKSPLVLWPWCPPLYPPYFSHRNTLFTRTVNITQARQILTHLHCQQETRRFTLLQRSADDEIRKSVHLCLCYLCVHERGRWRQNMRLVCVFTCACMCMLTRWHLFKQWQHWMRCYETFSWQKGNLFFSNAGLYSPHDYFSFFQCVFSHSFAKPPPKIKRAPFLFRQPAWPSKCTIAFLCELSCFPVC